MVIIQYNTMAMNIKTLNNKQQPRKRTLRSAAKQPQVHNNPYQSPIDQKIINEIKKQIEHQQIFTNSKSAYPPLQEVKGSPQSNSKPEINTRSRRKVSLTKKIQVKSSSSEPEQQSSHNESEHIQISIQAQLKSKQAVQPREESCTTPASKLKLKCNRISQYSAYKEERKSYRKLKRHTVLSVPYRKCQDQFEQRIVALINKISSGKGNQKDLQNLGEKIQKISLKDLYNPYVISGIHTILQLLNRSKDANVTCLKKLKSEVANLDEKICEQLGRIQQYSSAIIQRKKVDILTVKPLMMRKIYRRLTEVGKIDCQSARLKTQKICDDFFKKYDEFASQEDILDFMYKSSLEKI